MKVFRVMLLVMVVVASVATFTGCRTAHGFGEDMQNAGEAIQRKTD
jgi:predicted small secreted protein